MKKLIFLLSFMSFAHYDQITLHYLQNRCVSVRDALLLSYSLCKTNASLESAIIDAVVANKRINDPRAIKKYVKLSMKSAVRLHTKINIFRLWCHYDKKRRLIAS